jgi:hypothetical protein
VVVAGGVVAEALYLRSDREELEAAAARQEKQIEGFQLDVEVFTERVAEEEEALELDVAVDPDCVAAGDATLLFLEEGERYVGSLVEGGDSASEYRQLVSLAKEMDAAVRECFRRLELLGP